MHIPVIKSLYYLEKGAAMKKRNAEKISVILAVAMFAAALVVLIVMDTKGGSDYMPLPRETAVPVETPAPTHNIPVMETPEPQVSESQVFTKPAYSFPEDFTTELLGAEMFVPCPEGGTVQHISYTATDIATGAQITKVMDVYLPYAYSPDNRYNVLILSPGAGGDQGYWFREKKCENGVRANTRNLLDNMIYDGKIAPLIVVSITVINDVSCNGNKYDLTQLAIDGDQLATEIVDDIIPRVVETFSTYAEGTDRESISAAREHFGFIGLSWGSLMGYYRVFPNDFEYISWFGFLASSSLRVNHMAKAVKGKEDTFPIRYVYAACGTKDGWYSMSKDLAKNFAAAVPGVTDGVNAAFVGIEEGTHNYGTWIASLYNCLLAFFD